MRIITCVLSFPWSSSVCVALSFATKRSRTPSAPTFRLLVSVDLFRWTLCRKLQTTTADASRTLHSLPPIHICMRRRDHHYVTRVFCKTGNRQYLFCSTRDRPLKKSILYSGFVHYCSGSGKASAALWLFSEKPPWLLGNTSRWPLMYLATFRVTFCCSYFVVCMVWLPNGSVRLRIWDYSIGKLWHSAQGTIHRCGDSV